MKKILFLMATAVSSLGIAQANLDDLFAAGIDDAQRFTNDYLAPVSESVVYSISNGWYNSAKAKPLGGFEISIIGNITGFKNKDDKTSFVLNTAEYENLQFVDGETSKSVSTALGDIEGVRAFVEVEVAPGVTERQEFELPTGLLAEGLNFMPSGYLQGSVGLIKGLEVKARFLPKIDTDDVKIGLFGAGLQYDFTSSLPADKLLPVAISGVIGYTSLTGEYDFTDAGLFDGDRQIIDTKFSSWTFNAVASTRLPVINFYGGLGYVTGKSTTDVLGDYTVGVGPLSTTETDPFSISRNVSGVTANVGTKLKLGFFRLNVDYTLAEFNTLTAGINFGFR
ncbi:DUF6588 family protein [Costertonia aggregata]|uniref:Outer membrane beta-barrel protein n=1 Tax=Costertonia aggregata TaxID=343403 RepID=A0A7H9ARX4_9FLAO|nr:DUF6588 family protein [Costertonia aggregata]QLG46176.1 hypothetical protein HYG79_12735 [Costertonia aggregata]